MPIDTSVLCPQCESPMVKRNSVRGPFYGCSSYPTCRGTRPYDDTKALALSRNDDEITDAEHAAMSGRSGWISGGSVELREKAAVSAAARALLKGSPQQEQIWKFMLRGKQHGVVDAVAGSGKSTTLVEGVKRIPTSVQIGIMAFNSHISREMNEKLREAGCRHATSLTYNSCGWRAVLNAYPGVRLMDDKLDSIIEECVPQDMYRILSSPVQKMVRLLKCHLLHEAKDKQMEDLLQRFDLDIDSSLVGHVLAYAPKVLKESVARTSVADFDDQVYWPVLHKLPVRTYEVLMVDEAQDTSIMQQKLVMMACPKGRIFVVGDKHQAIYGFRGADVTAIGRMRDELEARGGVEELKLTVSRRCPKSHVKLAQQIVPHITAMTDAPEGVIQTMELEKASAEMRPGDLAVCRVNAPLVSACYTLIRQGISAIVRGRDIGKGLIALLRRLRAASIPELSEKLRNYETLEMAKLAKLGRKGTNRIIALQDKVDCLITLCEGASNLSEVQYRIETMFSDFDETGKPRNSVVFSTVHRAKGLEAPNVFILSPELMPHPMAKQAWEKEQEANLAYVAVTRAKYVRSNEGNIITQGRLVFCGQIPPAFGGPKPDKPAARPKGKFEVTQQLGLTGPVPLDQFFDEEEES